LTFYLSSVVLLRASHGSLTGIWTYYGAHSLDRQLGASLKRFAAYLKPLGVMTGCLVAYLAADRWEGLLVTLAMLTMGVAVQAGFKEVPRGTRRIYEEWVLGERRRAGSDNRIQTAVDRQTLIGY
jgi:hypothetical protein